MSLSNTIAVDLTANTVVLTASDGGNSVDVLTFALSGNTVTFASRLAITIATSDYLKVITQMSIFQAAILQNFNINQLQTSPFTSFTGNETYISFINEWNLEITVNGTMFISNITQQSTDQTTLLNRPLSQTLNFSEWTMVLNSLLHYSTSIRNFLGL